MMRSPSPGELGTIFGTNTAPATAAGATVDPAAGKLATTIGGVQVLFNGSAAPMIYASSAQVSAVVPYEMAPVVSPSVWIKYAGQASNAYPVHFGVSSPLGRKRIAQGVSLGNGNERLESP